MKWILSLIFVPISLFAFEPHVVTPYPVLGYRESTFQDPHQNVQRTLMMWYPVNSVTTGSPSKDPWDTFNVAVDAPIAVASSPYPVIVLSHGYLGNPHHLSWLIRGLVHEGFFVLGMQHRDLIEGKAHLNHWMRAQDVSVMLDQLKVHPLAQTVDLNRIGIAGFSLGGTTAIWVAGGRTTHLDKVIPGSDYASVEDFVKAEEALPTLNKEMMARDWKEPRIKAAFVMAPAWSWLFDEQSLSRVSIPVYLIAAEADSVLVTKNNAGFFARHIPHAIYKTISGKADHFIFVSSLTEKQQKLADPSRQLSILFLDNITIDRAWIQSQVVEESVRFFRSL